MDEKRIAIVAVIVKNRDQANQLNLILHDYGEYIISRNGIGYNNRDVNIITVILDAPQNAVNALSGKIGRLGEVEVKTTYLKI